MNNDKYMWHDLRKNPDDLPEENKLVIATIQGSDVIRVLDGETLEQALERINRTRYASAGRYTDEGWCGADWYPMIVHPIAWKYIEPFKEDELNV